MPGSLLKASGGTGASMKVTVLGAGIIGVTSAYQLAKAGHEVVVIDRQSAPAMALTSAKQRHHRGWRGCDVARLCRPRQHNRQ